MTRTLFGCGGIVSFVLSFIGCGPRLAEKASDTPTVASESTQPGLAADDPVAHIRWPPDLQLPAASQLSPIPDNSLPIVISDSALWVGAPLRWVANLPPRASRIEVGFGGQPSAPADSRYVPSLAGAIQPIMCGPDPRPFQAVLFVDRRIPSRLLFDAISTLSRGFDRFYLAAVPTGGGSPGVLPFDGQEHRAPSVRVGISDDGIGVQLPSHENWLGVGCASGVAGPTIPLRAGRYDIDAAVDCVSSLPSARGPLSLEMSDGVYPDAYVTLLASLAAAAGVSSRPLTVQPRDDAGFLTRPGDPTNGKTNAARVVAGLRAQFRDCYNRELQHRFPASGTVRLTLTIGADGAVTRVRHEGGEGIRETTACAVRVAAKAKFEPPAGGRAIISVPVTFTSTEQCWRSGP